eukprot:TRINITY_DN3267_c0_g1_i1.p1 TRINITY_DN3267_c0_g1~~TRINITY_DN3267_c0_g1_i1.p1  ORF type:complete len:107 (+),score=12.05 TRINITY_DN3267_c0_g1_i1:327-647(+)
MMYIYSHQKFHIKITTGAEARDWQEVANKEHLTALQVSLRKIFADAENARAEQRYQKVREQRFRETSESTNVRVFWWSIMQITIVTVMSLWQMRHLTQYFKKKKLV